jgi:hypothetical protein
MDFITKFAFDFFSFFPTLFFSVLPAVAARVWISSECKKSENKLIRDAAGSASAFTAVIVFLLEKQQSKEKQLRGLICLG